MGHGRATMPGKRWAVPFSLSGGALNGSNPAADAAAGEAGAPYVVPCGVTVKRVVFSQGIAGSRAVFFVPPCSDAWVRRHEL